MNDQNKKNIEDLNKVRELRAQIKSTKEKRPMFIIGFALITVCIIYYLEDKVYTYFGNAINFITFGIVVFFIITLIYIYKIHISIQKKEKIIKRINKKLFDLMKLQTKDMND